MPDPTPPVATPVMMTDVYVELGAANLRCLCEEVSLTCDPNPITVTTFCGVQEYPGPPKWHMVAKFLQSFDTGATDDILSGAVTAYQTDGTTLPFKVRPRASSVSSPTNPSFEGELIPQPYTIFGGTAGSQSEVDIDWTMTAEPTRNTTGTTTQAARGANHHAPASS